MGWAVGSHNGRDVGYGVPAICDQPGCNESIDRGLGYVCGGEPDGGEHGCGLFFCRSHLCYVMQDDSSSKQLCERCADGEPPFNPGPDTAEWITHKLTDDSWRQWRDENPGEVALLRGQQR